MQLDQVEVGGRIATLTKDIVIGQGGESIIYKDPAHPDTHVLKIYREPNKQRADKLEAILKAKLAVPQNAVIPLLAVRGPKGNLVGFQMKRLNNRYRKLGMMFGGKYSRDHGLTSKVKADIFCRALADLDSMHPLGIVYGDVNDGNEMVDEMKYGLAWIDMDSVQFGRFPCMAGTQLYLCPDLYNVDLSKRPAFKPEHDWWSFTVLLFRALTNGVHPFKSGLHPRLQSLFDRAEKGVTVLDREVTYPEIGLPPEILGDELTDVIQRILKRKIRDPFPLSVLSRYRDTLRECSSCGLWYPPERKKCPSCAHTTTLDVKAAAAASGFAVSILIETPGRFLYRARIGTSLYAVAEEKDDVVFYAQEKGKPLMRTVLSFSLQASARYGIFDGSLVICPDPSASDPELYVCDVDEKGAELRKHLSTRIFEGARAVFATSGKFLYRIAGSELLAGEKFGNADMAERRIMQVFAGQTWFTAARNLESDLELVAGFHREFGATRWFMVRSEDGWKKSTRLDDIKVTPLDSKESVQEFALYFSNESVLLVRKTRKLGVDRVRIDVVSTTDGASIRNFVLEGSEIGPWERVQGKAYVNGLVMHPTDQGIVREVLADRTQQSLIFTSKDVSSLDGLDRLDAGILVAKTNRLVHIQPPTKRK